MRISLKDHPEINRAFMSVEWMLYRQRHNTTPAKVLREWGAKMEFGNGSHIIPELVFESDEACIQFLLARPWENPPWFESR